MPDFPSQLLAFPSTAVIQPGGWNAPFAEGFPTFSTGAVWPAANLAIYAPFWIESTVTAYQMFIEVTVQSGNCDVGIYNDRADRLISKGSTAVAAAGLQTFDITDTVLTPGVYYTALCVDNGTAAVCRSPQEALRCQVMGLQQQAVGAVTLPNPATFANPTNAYLPMVGIGLRATL